MAAATIIDNPNDVPTWIRVGGAISVGNFDGVHRGHAKIIRRLVEVADRLNGPAIVFSFQPHPASVLRPESAPAVLTWLERKAELLGTLGVAALVAYPTDRQVLELEPAEFFHQMIAERLAARAVVEGPNFQFGRQRTGSIDTLATLCESTGITLDVVPPLIVGGRYVSSSRIRELIAEGRIREANELLLEPHRLRGRVVRGAQRGRTIGFPTANLESCDVLLPPLGVYAGRAMTDAGTWAAALNLGPNPTFDDQTTKFEVHLIDFDGDLYGSQIEVQLLEHIRDVRSFDGEHALVEQLTADVRAVRLLVNREP